MSRYRAIQLVSESTWGNLNVRFKTFDPVDIQNEELRRRFKIKIDEQQGLWTDEHRVLSFPLGRVVPEARDASDGLVAIFKFTDDDQTAKVMEELGALLTELGKKALR